MSEIDQNGKDKTNSTETNSDQSADMSKPVEPEEEISSENSSPQRQPQKSEPVALPGPGDDAELEKEIEEALGDMSVLDVYDLESISPEATEEAEKEASHVPGINRGKVINVSNEGVFVDLGGKSQGFLPAEEQIETEDKKIEVGAIIEVSILRYDNRDGLLILSEKSAEQQLLRHNLKEGAMVEARVIGSNKGGLELDIKGLSAFMPASQIDIGRVEDMDSMIGQRIICEVVQVERGDKNIVLSRRNILEKEVQERREKLWDELEKGQLRHGVVHTLADYGAFVDLGGMEGLLHVSEMSWARVKHPKDILQEGQEIDVLITGVDKEKNRVSLSLRQAGGDPWTNVQQKYQPGSQHQAQIVNLMNFGAFAELEPGVEGLIPISEMSWAGRIRHPSDIVQTGMMVEVEVLNLDEEKRRISLSIKNLQENPWADVAERYIKNNVYSGTVSRLTDFGAFVTLESGIDGLIHVSELSDKRVNKVSDILTEGQAVQAKVLIVDVENRRIGLSLKGLAPVEETPSPPQAETADNKKKKQRPRRGGLTW